MPVPSYDACLVEAELRARAAYAEPGRHYHSERHLDDCLRHLDQLQDLDERERRLLKWAILWHDAIYDPERSDNEERSAELARRELLDCGIEPACAEQVARLIRLTSGHRAEDSDRLGAPLVSIDLAVLGSDPDRYRQYATDVRREYRHLTEDEWCSDRAVVLKQFLEADAIYPDPRFRAVLEQPARRNMEQELRALGAG